MAVKDARNDLRVGTEVIATTSLAYYSRRRPGEPAVAVGRRGRVRQRDRPRGGRPAARDARRVRGRRRRAPRARCTPRMLPLIHAMGRVGGVAVRQDRAAACAASTSASTRLPLPPATDEQVELRRRRSHRGRRPARPPTRPPAGPRAGRARAAAVPRSRRRRRARRVEPPPHSVRPLAVRPPVRASAAARDQRRPAPRRRRRSTPPSCRPSPPPALPDGALRVVALGGIGEIGRNMTVFEYDGRLLVVDCGVLFPAEDSPGRRPDPARLPRHRGPPRRHRRARAHPRPRGPHRRGAVPAAPAPRPAGRRLAVHARAGRGEVQGAPADPAPAGGHRGRPAARTGRGTASTSRSTTRSRTRWRSPSARRPALVLHTGDIKLDQLPLDGRLTDLAGFSRLGDEGVDLFLVDSTNADVPGFVIAEREIGPVLDGVFHTPPSRIIVACFASHVHRVQQVLDAAAAHGRGWRWSAGRWCATWAWPPTWASCNVPDGLLVDIDDALRAARRPAGDRVDRVAGRAAVGAVADGPRRPPLGADHAGRHRHPGQLADPGQRDRGVRRDQRADPARRHRRAPGQREGARVGPRAGR